jgi:hypothetical protein
MFLEAKKSKNRRRLRFSQHIRLPEKFLRILKRKNLSVNFANGLSFLKVSKDI